VNYSTLNCSSYQKLNYYDTLNKDKQELSSSWDWRPWPQ